MTPILFGRWQTRIFLLATIGLIVSLPFALGIIGPEAGNYTFHPIFFWVIFWVGVLGLLWDILYNYLQQYLWDHDWPGAFQFFACIAEGIVLGLRGANARGWAGDAGPGAVPGQVARGKPQRVGLAGPARHGSGGGRLPGGEPGLHGVASRT